MDVPFNKVSTGSNEFDYLNESLASGSISGDGPFTHRCHEFLEAIYGGTALLMHSCTAALEAAAILADLKPGDEVIMPSFTFVSTANAVVLRGAVPVFVDIKPDTLNIDETKIRAAIGERTRADHAGPLRRCRRPDGRDLRHRQGCRADRHRGTPPRASPRRSTASRSVRSARWAACRSTRPRTSSRARVAR